MDRQSRRWTVVALAAAVLVAAAIIFWPTGGFWKKPAPIPDDPNVTSDPRKVHAGAPLTSQAAIDPAVRAKAIEQCNEGLALATTDKVLDARKLLSDAIFTESLPNDLADKARAEAARLADLTLLSSKTFDGDPYTFVHTFISGEVLNKTEQTLKLHVPTQLILNVNGIARDVDIRAGQTVKMVYGPFHAVINKHDFTMDLYAERQGLPKVFVRRIKVGLGKSGGTPIGHWKLQLSQPGKGGGKMLRPRWDPPPNSEVRRSIAFGEPGYPLGAKGLWIGLEGTDDSTRRMTAYGIHSTSEPQSIGHEGSLGCVRLSDEDIQFVFDMLYESWSTVETRP